MTKACHIEPFSAHERSVYSALAVAGAFNILRKQKKMLIKPNLTNDSPHQIIFSLHISSGRLDPVAPDQKAEVTAR